MQSLKTGIVYITGAGPGDPGLITVKARYVLEQADAVVYDNLANADLLEYCKPDCERIYAGKKAGSHTFSQDGINLLLYTLANAGKKVVRLKGGDPFVFGRGGEEALYLSERHIDFEIIPGVTSGIAAAAYAGIPVTHRRIASTLTFISGHEVEGEENLNINWPAIATIDGTLVFYMGVKNLPIICDNLLNYGVKPSTPVAIIRYGTYLYQKAIFGFLHNIERLAKEADIQSPALIVVGEVVSLHEQMQWFDLKPMSGKRILVTRSRTQSSALSALLKGKGAEVIEFPTIEISPADDYNALYKAFSELIAYEWIVFTSVNSVEYFFKHLFHKGYDSRLLAFSKIACIGPETAYLLNRFGINPDLIPETYTTEGLLEAFQKIDINENSILLPTSNIARMQLHEELEKLGASVNQIAIYKNDIPNYSKEELDVIFHDSFDCITFTSSSTINNFMTIIKKFQMESHIDHCLKASIGPITTKSIVENGLKVDIEPTVNTVEGMVNAIDKYFLKKS